MFTAFELLLLSSNTEHVLKEEFVGDFEEPLKTLLMKIDFLYKTKPSSERAQAVKEHLKIVSSTELKEKFKAIINRKLPSQATSETIKCEPCNGDGEIEDDGPKACPSCGGNGFRYLSDLV